MILVLLLVHFLAVLNVAVALVVQHLALPEREIGSVHQLALALYVLILNSLSIKLYY
jgi:hypothetical protein